MPFTFFAHQIAVLPAKIRRPRWFDGTALVIGSIAPDFGYPVRGWVQRHSHQFSGLIVWSLPFTIVVTLAIRSWVAGTAFAQLPDAGPLRLHSFRALRDRRTPWWMLLYSAFLGAGSHILMDAFTHKNSFVSRWMGLDRTLFHAPWDSGVSIARTLQYLGHTVGSVLGVMMLAVIGRRRLMEQWYGLETVVAARRFRLRRPQRVTFWLVSLSGLALGPAMGLFARGSIVTKTFMTMAATTALACSLDSCKPRERALSYFDSIPGDPTPAPPTPAPPPDLLEPLEPRPPRAAKPRSGRAIPPPPHRRPSPAAPQEPPGPSAPRKSPGWYD